MHEPTGDGIGSFDRVAFECAFPDYRRSPAPGLKNGKISPVAFRVACELLMPELRAAGRSGGVPASLMAMPKAAVHKDNCLVSGKNEIR